MGFQPASVFAVASLLYVGCSLPATGEPPAESKSGAPESTSPAGSKSSGDPTTIPVAPNDRDVCGNGVDDNGDGRIDEDCACTVGAVQPCWPGAADRRGVGNCHDGQQTCVAVGEFGAWSVCQDYVVPADDVRQNGVDEDCSGGDGPDCRADELGESCTNGGDDDCDELVDCSDPDCAGTPSCCSTELCDDGVDNDCDGLTDCADPECARPICCPPGQQPAYRERDLAPYLATSSVVTDGQPLMPVSCEASACPADQVQVILVAGGVMCVAPPGECPPGTDPAYDAASGWRCAEPCEVLIHFGALYAGEQRCAHVPNVSCGGGTVPTFLWNATDWSCGPDCSVDFRYDPVVWEGILVCVPC